MKLSDFDYNLPKELIAQTPVEPRDHSRLMIVNTRSQRIEHDYFYNLDRYLDKNDVLIFNDTKVFPARLYGQKRSGGKVEILLLRFENNSWEFISRPGLKEEQEICFGETTGVVHNGRLVFDIKYDQMLEFIDINGHTPLPPYITPREGVTEPKLRQIYQTIYAKKIGSAAAPTAGFHFTENEFEKLKSLGVGMEYVTLQIGLGTFLPVKENEINNHKMHSEYYEIDQDTGERIKEEMARGKRIVAVGTTTVRTLESWTRTGKFAGETDIFIYPGYKYNLVDGMVTNFHLPKSTLLMLVSAFAGKDLIMKAYTEAVKEKYRFFSFGDAMLIL